MKKCRLLLSVFTLVALVAVSSAAQELSKAYITENCTTFTLQVGGEHLAKASTVKYSIEITPADGSLIKVDSSFAVTPQSNGDFYVSKTINWSDFGVTLSDSYTLRGKARLIAGDDHAIPIQFRPKSLTCKVTSNSCLPTSSLSVLTQGSNVTSYVPNGAWYTSSTGIRVVPIEGGGAPVPVSTPAVVNSCSSNSATGTTVCVSNNTDVYLLNGSAISSTLTDSADAFVGFSGGSCQTCGVAINNLTNTALVTIGMSTSPSLSGVQFLDLATNTFQLPLAATYQISEDVVWDQNRNLLLSPSEAGNYDVFQTSPVFGEFSNSSIGQILDSAAEDCNTGVALSAVEFTDQLFIADLTQASYVSGAPGTWNAPWQFQSFPEFAGFAAGTSGIAVSPGSHLAVVTGEFGGNQFGVLQLPATSGSGTPGVVDYSAAVLPNTPDGNPWLQGLDPHTMTAYQSPADGKAYGVFANGGDFNPPTYLAVIDLQGVLNAPRVAGTHTVDPSYDLIANNVLRYVRTF